MQTQLGSLVILFTKIMVEKVKAVQDNDSHWYIIPNYLMEEFESDLLNE